MATTWGESLTSGTIIKKSHIEEIRTSLAAERIRRGQSNPTFMTLTANQTPFSSNDLTIIRNNITNICTMTVTDSSVVSNITLVKKAHIEEIRTKINVMEVHTVVGGTTDCNSSCTGLCVGCVGTCTSCVGTCEGTATCHSNCHSNCYSDCHSNCYGNCNCHCHCYGSCECCHASCSYGCQSCKRD